MNRVWLLLSVVFVFFLNFIPPLDTDFGWHYRCGAELLAHHPCITNTFSYYLSGYQAYYSSFVFDGITALVYNALGFNGLSMLHALTLLGLVLIFVHSSSQSKPVSWIFAVISLWCGGSILSLGWRPQVVSYVLAFWFFVTIRKILADHESRRYVFVFPIVLGIWANTHLGFFTGIIFLGAGLFELLAKRIIHSYRFKHLQLKYYFLSMTLGIVATFCNPFGWRIYQEIGRHAASPLNQMIAEWIPPHPVHWATIICFALLYIGLLIMRKKLPYYQIGALAFIVISTLMARRNLPLFYSLAIFEILQELPVISIKKISEHRSVFLPICGACVIALAIFFGRHTFTSNTNWSMYCSGRTALYPCEIVARFPHLSGNIFTTYEYGGFLIWQLPQAKVFIDGRMPAWHDSQGESPYRTYLAIVQTQPGWNMFLDQTKTRYILTQRGTFLEIALRTNGVTLGWQKKFENSTHALYERIHPTF